MSKKRETARERRRRLRAQARCGPDTPRSEAIGELRILNAGAGDVRISFRPDATKEEVEQARTLIEKMLRDGYALLIQCPDGTYARAKGFDPETHSYILANPPPEMGAELRYREPIGAGSAEEPPKRRRGRPPKSATTVPVNTAKAVGVARSAGG